MKRNFLKCAVMLPTVVFSMLPNVTFSKNSGNLILHVNHFSVNGWVKSCIKFKK